MDPTKRRKIELLADLLGPEDLEDALALFAHPEIRQLVEEQERQAVRPAGADERARPDPDILPEDLELSH